MCIVLEECQVPCWEFPPLSPSWSHRAHTVRPPGIQWFWMFCCHLPEKRSLKSPASVPGLRSHIYSRVHEEYWSRPSPLYMGIYPWLLVSILGLFNNVVITTALVWDQCFSRLQGGCFRINPFFLSQIFEWSLQVSLSTSTETIPYLGIFQLLWSLNRTGFPSRGQLTPLIGNKAVPVR